MFVIRELTGREIKRKYARSFLGILWSVLNPLLSMTVMSLIFSTMFKRNIENYPIYYLTASILWSLFTGSTNAALTSLVDNKMMLIKVKLPMSIFPLSRCCTALVNFGYSLIAFVVMLLVFRIPPNPYMPLLLLYVAGLFFFSLGLGYMLSDLYTVFGDIKHLYSILLMLWMYMSALFYPVESTTPQMQAIILRNPIYNFISSARKSMLYAQPPNTAEWLRMLCWSAGIYLLGRLVFRKTQSKVLQRI
ncbi:MAG: ABC transporter permease [Lachnospiraceae bacterium]|nr:ABC transporter permease [Lachnospiraceae bacterium]